MRNKITLLMLMFAITSCSGEANKIANTSSDLVGTWQEQGKNLQLVYHADNSHFYCSVGVPFTLTNAGQTLTVGPSVYTRSSGTNPASIVGLWSDGSEDIYYRSDNRSIVMFDNEKIVYFGTYEVSYSGSGGVKTDCDYKGQYAFAAGIVDVRLHGNGVSSYSVNVVPNATLAVTVGGVTTSYDWVP